MASDRPDLPNVWVTRVANGYVVRPGSPEFGSTARNDETYVARNRAELVRVLDLIAVREKMSPAST